jgi:hypothetical protein
MKTGPEKDWISPEIAHTLGAKRESVQSTLSFLAKAWQQVTKASVGYRVARVGTGVTVGEGSAKK